MNKPESSSSGSNAGLVIVIAVLVLGLPCLAGVVLLGAGFFWASTVQVAPAPPVLTPGPVPVMLEPVLTKPVPVDAVLEATPNERGSPPAGELKAEPTP